MITAAPEPRAKFKTNVLDNQFDAREYYARQDRISIITPDDSLMGLNILAGDELLVEDHPCESGEVVVVKINEEFAPRIFVWNDVQNRIELHSWNYCDPPMIVGEVNILGVVVGVLWGDRVVAR